MLVILTCDFLGLRDKVKKSVIDMIEKTVDEVNEHKIVEKANEEVVAVLPDNIEWDKYNQNHKVAVKFIEDRGLRTKKINPQWYYDSNAKMYIIETHAPEKVATWAEGYPDFYYAFEKAVNFDYFLALSKKANDIGYTIVRSHEDELFKQVTRTQNFLGCDIETRGFSWTKDDILVHGFAYTDNDVMIIPHHELEKSPEFKKAFQNFIESDHVTFIWQNGKFDTKFYRNQGWDARVDGDTMLQAYALDERGGGHIGLESQATKILNTDGYKHKIKFETVSPEDPDLHYYLAQDCIYTRLINQHHNRMMAMKTNAHSKKLYETILLKASWALLRLEENGFYIRREYAKELEKDWGSKLIAAENELINLANAVGYTPMNFVQWSGQKSVPTAFKCGSPKQLAYVLIGLLNLPKFKGKVSTDKKAMLHWLFNTLDFPVKDEYEYANTKEEIVEDWFEKSPNDAIKNAKKFLWNLIAYRNLKKMYSTYIVNAIEYSQEDGRVHATYKIHGTVTGRLSSGDPMNLQNIPRRKDIKCMFGAPEGKTLIECDYSQCELRVLAYLSQDPDIIQTYLDDGDLHDAVAIKMFGPDFTKEQRVGAKTVNFGLAYGRGKSSVAEQLRSTYQYASDLVDQWHASMPVASKFITETRARPKKGERSITPLGRERRFWFVNHKNENSCENEAINFPIQSTASDCGLMALHDFIKIIEADPVKWEGVFPVNIVHDAILVEAPDDKVDMAVELLCELMESVPKQLIPDLNVPMKTDAEVTKLGWGKKTAWEPGIVKKL